MNYTQALNLTLERNDAKALNVREYLYTLLSQLWRETEGFNGKRPFGNSDWQACVYKALIQAKLISGMIDSDGYIAGIDYQEADAYMQQLIKAMCLGD